MPKKRDAQKKKIKHPMDYKAEETKAQMELEKKKEEEYKKRKRKEYRERIAKEKQLDPDDPLLDELMRSKITLTAPNTPNIPNRPNTPNTPNTYRENDLIKYYLSKEKRPYQNIGRGIHKGVFYIGTYVQKDDGKTHTAIVTSDRKMFINHGNNKNQIKNEFDLCYREDFGWEVLETSWSNDSIKKFLFENYTVDVRKLYEKLKEINKKFMIYEDPRIHSYIAIDILRSYFFPLFNANSRTHLHADPGSGKTNQTMLFRAFMFNPICSSDFSPASLYRTIEATGGTILIDDFDYLPDDDKQKIDKHIRVNYKRFKSVRSDGGGRNRFKPQGCDSYSHLVFNNTIGIPQKITKQRVISLRLLRHSDAPDIEIDFQDPAFKPIRDDLYICLLQYWKNVSNIYKKLKVKELKGREREIFKSQLSIAKVIGDDVYEEILSFALDYLQREKTSEDLSEDWGTLLFEHIFSIFEREKIHDSKRELDFSPNEIAKIIVNNQFADYPYNEREKKIHQVRSYIGGALSGSILFRITRPRNRVFYHINLENLIKVLESKNMLGLFKERLGVLGVLGQKSKKSQRKIDFVNEKSLDLESKIQELKDYIFDQQKKGNKITYDNLVFNFSQDFIEECKRQKIIIPHPKGGYVLGG